MEPVEIIKEPTKREPVVPLEKSLAELQAAARRKFDSDRKQAKKAKEKAANTPSAERNDERRGRDGDSIKWRPAENFLARLGGQWRTAKGYTGFEAAKSAERLSRSEASHLFLFTLWALQLDVDKQSHFAVLPFDVLLCVLNLILFVLI